MVPHTHTHTQHTQPYLTVFITTATFASSPWGRGLSCARRCATSSTRQRSLLSALPPGSRPRGTYHHHSRSCVPASDLRSWWCAASRYRLIPGNKCDRESAVAKALEPTEHTCSSVPDSGSHPGGPSELSGGASTKTRPRIATSCAKVLSACARRVPVCVVPVFGIVLVVLFILGCGLVVAAIILSMINPQFREMAARIVPQRYQQFGAASRGTLHHTPHTPHTPHACDLLTLPPRNDAQGTRAVRARAAPGTPRWAGRVRCSTRTTTAWRRKRSPRRSLPSPRLPARPPPPAVVTRRTKTSTRGCKLSLTPTHHTTPTSSLLSSASFALAKLLCANWGPPANQTKSVSWLLPFFRGEVGGPRS